MYLIYAINLQLSYLFNDEQDYALSKDVDVVLWQTYRAYTHQPDLVQAFDIVIVDSDLHDQFDIFKRAEIINSDTSYLEMNSLIHLYICQDPQLCSSVTEKYGKTYLRLTTHQVDDLCQWIYRTREQHTHSHEGCIFEV